MTETSSEMSFNTSGDVQTYLKIEKHVVGSKTRTMYGCALFFLLIAFSGSMSLAIGQPAPVAAMCSPMCQEPGLCMPFVSSCVPSVVDDVIIYCKPGWTGTDCVVQCECGEEGIPCRSDGTCMDCAAGYKLVDGVCMTCPIGYTTYAAGDYAMCEFCQTNYVFNDDSGVTCTQCATGQVTAALGPHQDDTVCVTVA